MVQCGSRFHGRRLRWGDFRGVQFSGGMVSLRHAEFPGGPVGHRRPWLGEVLRHRCHLLGTKFSGGMVTFHGAKFSSTDVVFAGGEFSAGSIVFGGARFSGATVDLGDADDWSYPPTFGFDSASPIHSCVPRSDSSRIFHSFVVAAAGLRVSWPGRSPALSALYALAASRVGSS